MIREFRKYQELSNFAKKLFDSGVVDKSIDTVSATVWIHARITVDGNVYVSNPSFAPIEIKNILHEGTMDYMGPFNSVFINTLEPVFFGSANAECIEDHFYNGSSHTKYTLLRIIVGDIPPHSIDKIIVDFQIN